LSNVAGIPVDPIFSEAIRKAPMVFEQAKSQAIDFGATLDENFISILDVVI
jgi:hypothetical protein